MKLNDFGYSVNKKEGKENWLGEKEIRDRLDAIPCYTVLTRIATTSRENGPTAQSVRLGSLIWIKRENNHLTPRYGRLPSTAHCSWLRSYIVTVHTHSHSH